LAARLEAARAVNPLLAIVRGAQRGIEALSSVSRQLVVTDGPRSPLTNGDRQASRFETFTLPAARRAALALGGSRNDLLVAGVAAGLGRYHERMGLPCGDLRLAMPAGQHRGPGAGGNWFSITRLDVPTSNVRPATFFGVMSERLAHARREPALTFSGVLAAAVNYLPTRILVPALHSQVSSVDFVATAVPGFRRPRHIGGAVVEASFPFGPRLGRLLNVVGAGNDGRLDVGLSIDPVAIDHPDVLVACIQEALHALIRSADFSTCPRPG
jgi:hypothetical protein